MTPTERHTVIFSGRVQGVGFRWTTRRIAGQFAVTGWVRNEPDGTVHLVAEGTHDELSRFVAAIEEAMRGHITEKRVERSLPTGEFDGFEIAR